MNHSNARINYDRMSRWYDWFTGSEKRFTEIGLQTLNIQPGEKVLEIGFGTGQSLIGLARSTSETGKVFGLDLSGGMLQVANKKLSRYGLSNRVDLCLGDATSLPYTDEFCEAIFVSFTLELFDTPEIPLVLDEFKRVLVDGGRLCVVALENKESRAVKIYDWFHSQWPILVDCRPIDVNGTIASAGFTTVEARQETMWGLPVGIILARKYG